MRGTKMMTLRRGITAVVLLALLAVLVPAPPTASAQADAPFGCTMYARGSAAILEFSGTVVGSHAHLRDQDGWVAEVTNRTSYRDSGGADGSYHVVMRNPQVIRVPCTKKVADFTCSSLILGDDAMLFFWGQDVGARAAVFQNRTRLALVTGETHYLASGGADGTFRVWLNQTRQSVKCDQTVPTDFSCSVAEVGDSAELTFTGSAVDRGRAANLLRDGNWIATVTGRASHSVANGAGSSYVVKLHNHATAVACAEVTTPPVGSRPFGQTGDWVLDFEDNFDGNALDLDFWEPVWYDSGGFQRPVNNNENACYHEDQVEVSGGLLRMSLSAENDPACVIKDGSNSDFVGAQITTRNSRNNERYETTSGYFEARMFLPSTNGELHNWPGFWVNGYDWPSQGEIDIMEGLRERQPCASFHWQDASGRHQHEKNCADYAEAGGWHIFAAEWGQGEVTFYYDGVELSSAPAGTVTNEPHFMALQYTTNTDWGAPVLDTMLVDYVRVWQRAG